MCDFAGIRFVRLGKNHVVTSLVSHVFNSTYDCRKEKVHHFRDDYTNRIRLFLAEVECYNIGLIVQFFCQCIHRLFGIYRNIRMVF